MMVGAIYCIHLSERETFRRRQQRARRRLSAACSRDAQEALSTNSEEGHRQATGSSTASNTEPAHQIESSLLSLTSLINQVNLRALKQTVQQDKSFKIETIQSERNAENNENKVLMKVDKFEFCSY